MSEAEPKSDIAEKPNETQDAAETKGKGNGKSDEIDTKTAVIVGLGLLVALGAIVQHESKKSGESRRSSPTSTASAPSEASEPSAVPSAPSNPVVVVSVLDLVADYQKNEVGADLKYKDKVVEISGTSGEVSKTATSFFGDGAAVLYVYGSKGKTVLRDSKLLARFDEDRERELANVDPGKEVAVRCTCEGMTLGSLDLKHCSVVRR